MVHQDLRHVNVKNVKNNTLKNNKWSFRHVVNTQDVHVLAFSRLLDALEYVEACMNNYARDSFSNSSSCKLRPLSVVTDVDETLFSRMDDDIKTGTSQLNHDEPRALKPEGNDGLDGLIVRTSVLDLITQLANTYDAEVHVVSARPTEEGSMDLLKRELSKSGVDGSMLKSVHIYPSDFPDDSHSGIFEESIWTFKETQRMACRMFTRCILEIGDRCWDCMPQELMRHINSKLALDIDGACQSTIVVVSKVGHGARFGVKLPAFAEK